MQLIHLYRLLLIFSSLSLTFAIFLVNKGVSAFDKANAWAIGAFPHMPLIEWTPPNGLLTTASYLSYFLACILISNLGLYATRWLPQERVDGNSLQSVELVNDTFLPIYLAYFFVALSTTSYISFSLVFGIILIFVYCSGSAYFDPMYVIRGYKIYSATSKNNVKIYVVSKKILKDLNDLSFGSMRRINDFTFIEIGGDDEPRDSSIKK